MRTMHIRRGAVVALAVGLTWGFTIPTVHAANFPVPTFRVRTENPLIGGVAVKLRVRVTCGPFGDGLEYYYASVEIRQATGDRVARASGYFPRGEPICDGVAHAYRIYLIPGGDDPVAFHAGEALVTRSFEICGTGPEGYRCEYPAYRPKVITITVPEPAPLPPV